MIQISRYIVCRNIIGLHNAMDNLFKRNAGHSKWSNIKHIKAAKDYQKALIFKKLSQLIKLAVQEGGNPDPNMNFHLANVLEQAKRHNMPGSSIKKAIEDCKDSKTGNVKSLFYELRGPGGCTIIVSAITDNTHKVKTHINSVARKFNLSLIEGSVPGLFDAKGIIQADLKDKTLETAVEHAIEVGAEDVTEDETEDGLLLEFVCEPVLLNQVKGKLLQLGYDLKSTETEFFPKRQVSLSDADLKLVEKIFHKLEEEHDIVKLSDNIA